MNGTLINVDWMNDMYDELEITEMNNFLYLVTKFNH